MSETIRKERAKVFIYINGIRVGWRFKLSGEEVTG